MHTIDLLRGKGIPAKTTLKGIVIIMVTVAVPFLAAIGILDRYFRNKTVISIRQRAIVNERATSDKLADAVEFKDSLEQKRDLVHSRLSEVTTYIGDYIQWSPVLVTLVKNMPAKMVLSRLTAETRREREKVFKDNDPNQSVDVTVSKRVLALDISGSLPGNYDSLVRDYRVRLTSPDLLGPQLEDITVSQKPGGTGDDKTVSWTMNLIFKSGT
ncbi:MAG: hypothetical protein ACYTFW_17075 [Planctomycetota bacterium]|jgi:hypothetical protein